MLSTYLQPKALGMAVFRNQHGPNVEGSHAALLLDEQTASLANKEDCEPANIHVTAAIPSHM